MRLINELSLSEAILGYFTEKIDKGEYEVDAVDCHADIQAILRSQPTAYDSDRVMEQLKAQCGKTVTIGRLNGKTLTCGFYLGILKAIEIVKGGNV